MGAVTRRRVADDGVGESAFGAPLRCNLEWKPAGDRNEGWALHGEHDSRSDHEGGRVRGVYGREMVPRRFLRRRKRVTVSLTLPAWLPVSDIVDMVTSMTITEVSAASAATDVVAAAAPAAATSGACEGSEERSPAVLEEEVEALTDAELAVVKRHVLAYYIHDSDASRMPTIFTDTSAMLEARGWTMIDDPYLFKKTCTLAEAMQASVDILTPVSLVSVHPDHYVTIDNKILRVVGSGACRWC
jgi:hypothetical protein